MVKMVELLAAEIPEIKFVIVGPGWVKTKIHQATILAKNNAGDNYKKTLEKFKEESFVPINKVVECCNMLVLANKKILSGRNISVEFDNWNKNNFIEILSGDHELLKLRRYGNIKK